MKITDYLPAQQSGMAGTNRQDRTGNADFSEVLEDVGRQSDQATEAQKTGPAGALLEASNVGAIQLAAAGPDVRLEEALAALDQFGEALADPNQTLKEMAPLVDDLETRAGDLDRLSRSLPDDNPLKPLLEETAILASVEAIKFNRGDY